MMIITKNMQMTTGEVLDSPEVKNLRNIQLKLFSLRQGMSNEINHIAGSVEFFS